MKSVKISNKIFFILLSLMLLTGCSVYHGPQSPYSKYYENMFENIKMPQSQIIQKIGVSETYSKPPDEVWAALLKVVSQYEGIIGTETESSGVRKLMFIHGQKMQIKVNKMVRNNKMVMNKFLDTWITVCIVPVDEGRHTMVSAAFISPQTGEITADFQRIDDEIKKGKDIAKSEDANTNKDGVDQNKSAADSHNTGSDLSQNKMTIASNLDQIKEPEKRWKYVPQSTIAMFFYQLETQLYGPNQWMAKFVTVTEEKVSSPKILNDIEFQKISEENAKLENDLGNWTSARFRRSLLVVDAPAVSNVLQEILNRLKKNVKRDDQKGQVYIIASPEVNAFALPNGDIMIFSGLLDLLDTREEIAAVLGHELDHILQHDTLNRLESLSRSQNVATTIMVIGVVASAGAGAAIATSAAASASTLNAAMAASASAQTVLIQNLTTNAVTSLSGSLGQSVGNSIIFGYSQEIELRADQNGAKYIWASGYNVEAELSLLNKLSEFKSKASKRNENVSSALINCEPGIDKRTEELKKTIDKIKM
jgi:Zn-dependent protease with chaperone function